VPTSIHLGALVQFILPLACTAIALGCGLTGEPDLCKAYPPTCEGQVAVNCISQQPCDLCKVERSFSRNDCDRVAERTGIAKACRISEGSAQAQEYAVCVDASLTDCDQHAVDEEWCTIDGRRARCYGTTEGRLVTTESPTPMCEVDGGTN
jgi:hypothetical protein